MTNRINYAGAQLCKKFGKLGPWRREDGGDFGCSLGRAYGYKRVGDPPSMGIHFRNHSRVGFDINDQKDKSYKPPTKSIHNQSSWVNAAALALLPVSYPSLLLPQAPGANNHDRQLRSLYDLTFPDTYLSQASRQFQLT
jgi:hypothetical protein